MKRNRQRRDVRAGCQPIDAAIVPGARRVGVHPQVLRAERKESHSARQRI
jgi:hypothetical protein